jgi:hypothetical protein
VKSSKAEIHAAFHKIPRLRFTAERTLTSYAGLVLVQALIAKLGLKAKLSSCFADLRKHAIYGPASIVMLVVVIIMLGFRRLRDLDFCREDPMLARVAGLRRLPDVATVSRTLAACDDRSIDALRERALRGPVLDRLAAERFARVTADFDGSVQSTCGHAEGTAVGYNPRRKGARSYYPLFCTIAQTDQFFDIHHRPGNVHDSNGAHEFMGACFWQLGQRLPGAKLETRLDSAFFNELVLMTVEEHHVEFTCTVPFERFPRLKQLIEARERWARIDDDWSWFETVWKPERWDAPYRLVFARKRRLVRTREPLQLDLFIPKDFEYEYTVIATNKAESAKSIVAFHHGRGSQEKLFGEAKQHAALDVIAGKRLCTNRVFTIASMLAHNLSRELQMAAAPAQRATMPTRAARWAFQSLGTIRQWLLHRAGKLSRPQGELTLTVTANATVESALHRYLSALTRAG